MDTPFFIYFSKNFEIKFLTFSLNSLLKNLIEIVTQPGTLRVSEKIEVKNNDGLEINKWYPNMEKTFTGWEKLGAIGTEESKEKLKLLAKSDKDIIQEHVEDTFEMYKLS